MASLKEIKTRIASVKNTLKITSAMKLIASAKLHKAQMAIEGMLPYNQRLTSIVNHLLSSEEGNKFTSPLITERELKRVAIVTVSSNTSLCGTFNSNIIRLTEQVVKEYEEKMEHGNVVLIPIGRKVAQASVSSDRLRTASVNSTQDSNVLPQKKNSSMTITDYIEIGDKPTFAEASSLASRLTEMYLHGDIDRVELLYTHYKNMAVQVLVREPFLPIEVTTSEKQQTISDSSLFPLHSSLIEPSIPELTASLLPQVLSSRMYAMLLDSSAAEHAARTFAMQQATDNGEGLLQELNLQYNKGRQQAITNELLDIVGGQMRP